tara:strand:+ start:574 stop:702 length:129 start_codon:yes stop_codon:yes gene_type:complete
VEEGMEEKALLPLLPVLSTQEEVEVEEQLPGHDLQPQVVQAS